jgi:membrane-bound inhibitor of C-type lysozyme
MPRGLAAAVLIAALLGGCGRSASSPSAPPAAPAAKGQVNPDAGVTDYACADGQTITAGYPDRQTAVVTYRGHAYTLKLARSGSGARYTGYGLQWWTKGDHASIAALRPGEEVASAPTVDCTAARPPQDEAVTHTSFAPAGRLRPSSL